MLQTLQGTNANVATNISAITSINNVVAALSGTLATSIGNTNTNVTTNTNAITSINAVLGDGTGFATDAELAAVSAALATSISNQMPKSGGTFTGNVSHGNNVKAQFGTGNDLQIYNDGADSVITEQGTGSLYIGGDSTIALTDAAVTQNKAQFITGGAVNLFYNNALKLATTNTGIDVTGGLNLTGTLTLGANVINDVEDIYLRDKLLHDADTDTYLGFSANTINLVTGGTTGLSLYQNYVQAFENVVGSVHTDTNQGTGTHTPDFQNYNSFVWTLTGNITLGNPTTEIAGMSGVFIFTHSGAGRTVSLSSDYETAGAAGLTLSSTAGAVDIVPYFVQATGNILLGTPMLAFS
jgi:hypothetical protein